MYTGRVSWCPWWQCRWDRQTPDRYIKLSARCSKCNKSMQMAQNAHWVTGSLSLDFELTPFIMHGLVPSKVIVWIQFATTRLIHSKNTVPKLRKEIIWQWSWFIWVTYWTRLTCKHQHSSKAVSLVGPRQVTLAMYHYSNLNNERLRNKNLMLLISRLTIKLFILISESYTHSTYLHTKHAL